jgi:hypothetical protein
VSTVFTAWSCNVAMASKMLEKEVFWKSITCFAISMYVVMVFLLKVVGRICGIAAKTIHLVLSKYRNG